MGWKLSFTPQVRRPGVQRKPPVGTAGLPEVPVFHASSRDQVHLGIWVMRDCMVKESTAGG